MADVPQHSLSTVIEAAQLFGNLTQADVDNLILRLDLEGQIPLGGGLSKQNKVNQIIDFSKKNPSHSAVSGANVVNELVEEAGKLVTEAKKANWSTNPHHLPFLRALKRDGFLLTNSGAIQRTLPDEADLPQAENELNELLAWLKLNTVKGHLDQARENHSEGNWAAANGQLRTCLEALFDGIAVLIDPDHASQTASGHNRRQLLSKTKPPFLMGHLGEWTPDGKNFVEGIFKRLHPEGSHPGLSEEEDCTFRLHMVLITARYFLRRAKSFASES